MALQVVEELAQRRRRALDLPERRLQLVDLLGIAAQLLPGRIQRVLRDEQRLAELNAQLPDTGFEYVEAGLWDGKQLIEGKVRYEEGKLSALRAGLPTGTPRWRSCSVPGAARGARSRRALLSRPARRRRVSSRSS